MAEEAAGWVARLQSADATDADRSAFQAWLSRDAGHRRAFDEFNGLWDELKLVPVPSVPGRKSRPSKGAAIANVVGLCLVAGLSVSLYRMGLIDRLRADHYTTVGEVRSFGLDDATRVTLNTDSAIVVRFTGQGRRIELLRGEAFFDVAKDPARPFVVADDGISATVVGTRFAMRRAVSGLAGEVQVEEGTVDVRSGTHGALLKAGDVATLAGDGALSVDKADVANATAWTGGQLVFSGEPLGDVLAALERYRHGRIAVLGDGTAQLRVSGVFSVDDTDLALRALEQNLPVRVNYLTDMLVVVSAR